MEISEEAADLAFNTGADTLENDFVAMCFICGDYFATPLCLLKSTSPDEQFNNYAVCPETALRKRRTLENDLLDFLYEDKC